MRIGLALPHYGDDASLERVIGIAVSAERLGFDSVWLSDHIVFDLEKYGGSPELLGSLEPLGALAAIGQQTARVRLGTMVLCNEFRHPLMVAKQAAVIGDRLELGLGAGWYEREFKIAGLSYPSTRVRMERLGESVQILKRAFTGEPVMFRGKHYTVDGFVLGQQVDMTIWVGGKGPRVMRLIVEVADGWNAAWFQDPNDYAERAKLLGDATIRRSIGQYAQGSPQEMVDRLASFAALGVEHAVMCFSKVPFGLDDPDDLSRFAQDVLPHVSTL